MLWAFAWMIPFDIIPCPCPATSRGLPSSAVAQMASLPKHDTGPACLLLQCTVTHHRDILVCCLEMICPLFASTLMFISTSRFTMCNPRLPGIPFCSTHLAVQPTKHLSNIRHHLSNIIHCELKCFQNLAANQCLDAVSLIQASIILHPGGCDRPLTCLSGLPWIL